MPLSRRVPSGCQATRVTSGSHRCASTCYSVFMPSRPRVCAIRLQTELSASHFLRDRPVTHTRSHVSPLHPQLAFCSTCCRAGSHSRALALTLHAHNLPNASCVTGTARGSLRCVCACECIACVCVCVWVCMTCHCDTTHARAHRGSICPAASLHYAHTTLCSDGDLGAARVPSSPRHLPLTATSSSRTRTMSQPDPSRCRCDVLQQLPPCRHVA